MKTTLRTMLGLLGLSLGALSPSLSAHAACDARAVTDAVKIAETSFVRMDADTFAEATDAVDDALSCQTEALSAIQIAAVHRVRALDAFFDGDEPGAMLAFQALLATMPGYELPIDIAPIGHPLRQTFDEAKLFSAQELFALPAPSEGWLTIDGRRTLDAPAARPFIFQRFDADGAVQDTAYVTVGVPVPQYPKAEVKAVKPDPVPVPVPQRRKVNGGLIASGLVLAAAGGVAYGVAFPTRTAYDEAVLAGDAQKIKGTWWGTNGLVAAGIVGVAGGGGLVLAGAF